MMSLHFASLAFALFELASASPTLQKRCTGTISSLSDVASAIKCTTININAFTVPAGKTFDLSGLLAGTTVNLKGNLKFAYSEWEGPLMLVDGTDITFVGGGYTLDGSGASYWDTLGGNGGKTKPKFIHLNMGGKFSNVKVTNTPVQAFSIGNSDTLVIDSVHIDNSAGNTLSDGKPLAHNTDCFDVEASGTTIQNSYCNNQDDCLAINGGSNIKFLSNTCNGGHGISIGSVGSGKTVSQITISGNTVTDSDNGLRIKTIYGATDASVEDVTYTGNTISGIADYGVVIEQDYENGGATGKASDGVKISNINFTGKNTVSVASGAKSVYVLCGSDSCTGTWNWSGLTVSGGTKSISPSNVPITNFSK